MPIDFTKPVKTDNYDTGLLSAIRGHVVALACMLDPTDAGAVTSPPTGARRFNASTGVFERFSGTSWSEQSTGYLKTATAATTYLSSAAAATTYAARTTTISAGTGLTGGGSLDANRSLSLSSTGVVAGGYGGNNIIPVLSVDSQGRIFHASNVVPYGTWGISISGQAATAVSALTAGNAATADALWAANNYRINALGVGLSNNTAGTISASGSITQYSDARLKRDVRVIADALDKMAALRGVTYERIDLDDGRRHTGLIAQELQAVLPEAVWPAEDGMLTVAYGNVIGLLIEAIHELHAKVTALECRQ